MSLSDAMTADRLPQALRRTGSEGSIATSAGTAVSWGAIAAGAAAAAALSLILLILGTGLGLSAVSPWSGAGLGGMAVGLSTILWLTLTQLVASAMGGYLAGRLRTRWTDTHADEVYFRDTAHGFLAWGVASLATAALLTSVIGSILGSAVQVGTGTAGGGAAVGALAAEAGRTKGADEATMGYFVDALFRREPQATAPMPEASGAMTGREVDDASVGQVAAEVGRIFAHASRSAPLPEADSRYVAQVVAERTGLSPQQATQRVADVYAAAQSAMRSAEVSARTAADAARKASAVSALWLFVSLLVGAFAASLAATYGGRRRDA